MTIFTQISPKFFNKIPNNGNEPQKVSERIQEYKEQTWESSPGQCVPFSSMILSRSLASVVLVECDEPESECYFKCLNHNKPRIRRTRCICKEQY